MNQVQRSRRELGFAESDPIQSSMVAPEDVHPAVAEHASRVANELLARSIVVDAARAGHQAAHALDRDGSAVRVAVTREL